MQSGGRGRRGGAMPQGDEPTDQNLNQGK
jgi:hypothetical protein